MKFFLFCIVFGVVFYNIQCNFKVVFNNEYDCISTYVKRQRCSGDKCRHIEKLKDRKILTCMNGKCEEKRIHLNRTHVSKAAYCDCNDGYTLLGQEPQKSGNIYFLECVKRIGKEDEPILRPK